jgi:DNA-binding NtrC family response regulator
MATEALQKGVRNDTCDVLIIDLNTGTCPAGKCCRLQDLIRRTVPLEQLRVQTMTIFPSESTAAPALILLRPPLAETLSRLLSSVRKKWSQCSCLGLFCTGWETAIDDLHSLLTDLDDFIFCPFKEIDLIPRIRRLLPLENGSAASNRGRTIREKFHLESLVGESQSFLQVIGTIPAIASSDATVLICGETGTGKELFARGIHYTSPRKSSPFIPVNCGALPDQLFENELFGHAKGAFTGASSKEKGLLAIAEGGTLFLDEIDTLSLSAQIKILRFLQDREYRPLGSPHSLVADVRVIAATNADLRNRMDGRLFREDLYHRLNVLPLGIPPLRERIEDIPLLSTHFLTQFGTRHNRGPVHITQGALQKLMSYSWPGNVRELEGIVQRAVILTSGSTLQARDVQLPSAWAIEMSESSPFREAKSRAIEQFERSYLANLLATHWGNVSKAAKAAGKERRAFQRLLRKYGLERRAFRN